MNEGLAQMQRALKSVILKHSQNPAGVLLISQQLVCSLGTSVFTLGLSGLLQPVLREQEVLGEARPI